MATLMMLFDFHLIRTVTGLVSQVSGIAPVSPGDVALWDHHAVVLVHQPKQGILIYAHETCIGDGLGGVRGCEEVQVIVGNTPMFIAVCNTQHSYCGDGRHADKLAQNAVLCSTAQTACRESYRPFLPAGGDHRPALVDQHIHA